MSKEEGLVKEWLDQRTEKPLCVENCWGWHRGKTRHV